MKVLGRAHPTVVGLFHYGHRSNFVTPYESRLHHEIVIPPGRGADAWATMPKHKAEKLPKPQSLRLP